MRITFTANEGGFTADEYAFICGVAGSSQWLTFQRDADVAGADWGIHLEYTGQANGGYACVAMCRLRPKSLSVELGR